MQRLAFALVLVIIDLTAAVPTALAQPEMPVVLPMRERAALMDRWLETRLDTVVPTLMRREGIDMWIVSAREYNEDPVIETMLPATWIAARRRTILVFFDRGPDEGVERLAVARYDIGPFPRAWDPDEQPDQWGRLAEVIAERDPATIALNRSATFALADGLTDAEYDGFLAALPDHFHDRLVSGERLAIGWLETRIAEEMQVYPMICKIAHAIIAEGLSAQVIQPGVTTTDDVVWWYRERIRALKLTTWFQPSVSVQRADAGEQPAPAKAGGDFSARPDASTIYPGDLLHVDFGITYLGLNTDTQQHAYVLRPGETDAPDGLRHALAVGNRLQDILTNAFETGQRDPPGHPRPGPRRGHQGDHLHPPHRLPRPRRRPHHRPVGPARRRARTRRLSALPPHRLLHRTQRRCAHPGMGRQGNPHHARRRRLFRRRICLVHRRAADGALADSEEVKRFTQ